ncbi:MAG TPA: hypothetical protein VMT87_01210 [Vicinamibacteria bacterium]|nr:hypothetical protein [Vicinamibacteria bacterium]
MIQMKFGVCTVSTLVLCLSFGTALKAQDPNMPGSASFSPQADPAPAEMTIAERQAAAYALADRWASVAYERGYELDGWAAELVANLLRLDDARLRQASRAGSYGELIEIATGKNPDAFLVDSTSGSITPQALGDKSDDLDFTALNPCRVMDTRLGSGGFAGPRASGSTTTISTRSTTEITAQGGNPAGCPMPSVDAGAVAYTITVVDYTGNGFVTVFPFSATRPNASTLNFGPGSAPTPIANSSIVQQCVNCGTASDISIYVEGASTNVIVDVIGFFDPAPSTTCTATAGSLGLTGACQNYTSCALTNPSTRSRTVLCSAVATTSIGHDVGTHDEIVFNIATANNACGSYSTPGIGFVDVNAAVPTGCCWNSSAAAQATFTLVAGATQTYFLNADQLLGTGDSLLSGSLRCTLVN